MYSTVELSLKYIRYFLTASNGKGHGIHSPFVYQFVTQVLNKNNTPSNVDAIENRRALLKTNKSVIDIVDLGAGSRQSVNKKRAIGEIAKNALKQKKMSQLLYRMGVYFKPSHILEMGTSLGITSSYLAMSMPDSQFVTMEGSASIAQEAMTTFKQLNLKNVIIKEGDFLANLPSYLNSISSVGMVYIDGNHRYIPTMQYFNLLLEKVNEHSILIFDDIYWSAEMELAWEEIKKNDAVTLTIDLFHIGIVFFRKENKQKEHFTIRY